MALVRWARDLACALVFAVVSTAQGIPVQFEDVGYPARLWDIASFLFDLSLNRFVDVHKDVS